MIRIEEYMKLPLTERLLFRRFMSLFGKIVKTVVNVAILPVQVVRDVYTLGGIATEQKKPYTLQQLEKIKEEAND
jgi:hypothetical protein